MKILKSNPSILFSSLIAMGVMGFSSSAFSMCSQEDFIQRARTAYASSVGLGASSSEISCGETKYESINSRIISCGLAMTKGEVAYRVSKKAGKDCKLSVRRVRN